VCGKLGAHGFGDLVRLESQSQTSHRHLSRQHAQALRARAQQRRLVQSVSGGDLGATSSTGGDNSFTRQVGIRAADGVRRQAQLAGQVANGRQMVAGLQGAVGHADADASLDLDIDRRRIVFAQRAQRVD
jgi:hypothetical protein